MLEALFDLGRVVRLLPAVERGRRSMGPKQLLMDLRSRGAKAVPRTEAQRLRLRRMIRLVDRLVPGPANCYRRALIEIALDPDSAQKPIHFGLRHGGGSRTGHAWLDGAQDSSDRYDADFAT